MITRLGLVWKRICTKTVSTLKCSRTKAKSTVLATGFIAGAFFATAFDRLRCLSGHDQDFAAKYGQLYSFCDRYWNSSKQSVSSHITFWLPFLCAFAEDTSSEPLAKKDDSNTSSNVVITEKFQKQVGGHGLADNKPSLIRLTQDHKIILKPLGRGYKGEVERRFYNGLYEDDDIRESLGGFVPNYIGYTRLPHPNPKRQDTLGYIIFEDDTAQFSKPCIIDIKVGLRTFDDYSTSTKIRNELKNHNAQSMIGYRITGMRVYDPATDTYQVFSKKFGRSLLTSERSLQGLRVFLRHSNDLQERDQLLKVLEAAKENDEKYIPLPLVCPETQKQINYNLPIDSIISSLKQAQERSCKSLIRKNEEKSFDKLSNQSEGKESDMQLQISQVVMDQKLSQIQSRLWTQDCLSPEKRLHMQLKRLLKTLEQNPTHNFYSASVLLAYEGDPAYYFAGCIQELQEQMRKNGKGELKDKSSGISSNQSTNVTLASQVNLNDPNHPVYQLPVVLSSKTVSDIEGDSKKMTKVMENKSKQRTSLSNTTLIDFAHTYRLESHSPASDETRISSAKHYEDTDGTSKRLAEQDSSMYAENKHDTVFIEGLKRLVNDVEVLASESDQVIKKLALSNKLTLADVAPSNHTQSLEFMSKLFRDACGLTTSRTATASYPDHTQPVHYLKDVQAMLQRNQNDHSSNSKALK